MNEKIIVKSKMFLWALLLIAPIGFVATFVIDFADWHWSAGQYGVSYLNFESHEIPYLALMFVFLIWGLLFYFMYCKMNIVVTNRRVYGTSTFGKRVDLPLDSISAVGKSWLWGIDAGSSSGRIHFKFIQNRDEIHKEISKLLLERQEKKAVTATRQEMPLSNADELKKYKDLLDSGIITQEEFDAKKKQLLGL